MNTTDLVLALCSFPDLAKSGFCVRTPKFACLNELLIWAAEKFNSNDIIGDISEDTWYFCLPRETSTSEFENWTRSWATASVGNFRVWKID